MELALSSIDPLTALAGVGVCFAAAAIGSVAGMGAGMIVTLFLTPVIGAKAVIPVVSVLMLINNFSRAWVYRDALVPGRIALIAGVAIPMSALGALVYVRLDGAFIQVILGLALIASVPLRRVSARRKIAPTRVQVVVVSGIFGFLSSIVVGAGMLVIPILMGFGLAGPALLATDAAIAVLINLAKVVIFGTLDVLSLQLFILAVVMGLCTVPGTWVGAWWVRRTSIELHTSIIETLLVVGGVFLIWGALSA
ncbi:MAG: sulfite exporter TauE/SafE family protein [Silicimonas sp.]|nr:sulfite exporter TauE/SafE family protein [Silicimonas sp.]